jgi:hypothetical protein
VYVVNGAPVKQVPGRKTDMADCQWLATLHAHGLLRRSFVPAEHLLALKLALEGWDFYQRQIGVCDEHLQGLLGGQVTGCPAPDLGPKKELRHNAPKAMPELQTGMGQLFGTDLTRLPALNEYTLMKLYGAIGADLGRWPTEKHFTAWLGLAPAHQQSGRRRRRQWRPMGRGGRIFCLAAQSLANAKKTWLAGVYRRLRSLRGAKAGLKAVARLLAVLFYRAATKGWQYVEQGLEQYAQKYRFQQQRRLERLARQLGMVVAPLAPTS